MNEAQEMIREGKSVNDRNASSVSVFMRVCVRRVCAPFVFVERCNDDGWRGKEELRQLCSKA